MKAIKFLKPFVFVASLGVLASCEDVIELDLNDGDPQTVIDATLNTSTNEIQVLLTKSQGFYDYSEVETIGGAAITLTHENGTLYTLYEASSGDYQANEIVSQPGDIFTLKVNIDGLVYTAQRMCLTH